MLESTLPPSSNTGVLDENFKIRMCIDWLRVTCDEMTLDKFPSKMLKGIEQVKPFGNYNLVYQCASGLKICWNTDEFQKYGTHVIASGGVMDLIRESGFADIQVLNLFKPYIRNATRIDYAVDFNRQTDFYLLKRRYNRNEIKTRLKLDSEHYKDQGKKGSTINFGSRSSDKMVRVYDKAKQMGLLSEALTRVEMETKGRVAKALYEQMIKQGVEMAGNRMLSETIDFNAKWWDMVQSQMVFGSKLVLPHNKPNYQQWLEMVACSIEKKLEANEEIEAIHSFIERVTKLV